MKRKKAKSVKRRNYSEEYAKYSLSDAMMHPFQSVIIPRTPGAVHIEAALAHLDSISTSDMSIDDRVSLCKAITELLEALKAH